MNFRPLTEVEIDEIELERNSIPNPYEDVAHLHEIIKSKDNRNEALRKDNGNLRSRLKANESAGKEYADATWRIDDLIHTGKVLALEIKDLKAENAALKRDKTECW